MRDVQGNVCFEMAICRNDNVTKLNQNYYDHSIDKALNA